MVVKTGSIKYGKRAFHEDAAQAMGSDIVRGAIELITNADDAYRKSDGDIQIEYYKNKKISKLRIRDFGPGLTYKELESRLAHLGEKTSGFHEGEDVRGLFGRGAKDTAVFGKVKFETIRDNTYSWLEINHQGETRQDHEPVSDAIRKQLGLAGSPTGFIATIHITNQNIKLPTTNKLMDDLSNHIQLRTISASRQLIFQAINNGKWGKTHVIKWDEPQAELLLEKEILIGGTNEPAKLTIHKLSRPSDGRCDAYSAHGIEVRGSKATYDNTFFGHTSTANAYIRGTLDCLYIDHLLRDYDAGDAHGTKQNPSWIVHRGRHGLDFNHPFGKAIASSVLKELLPILENIEPDASNVGGGKKLNSALKVVCQELKPLLTDLLEDPDTTFQATSQPSAENPMIILPPKVLLPPLKTKTLSILTYTPSFKDTISLVAEASDTEIIEAEIPTDPKQYRNSNFPDTAIANIKISALAPGDAKISIWDEETSISAFAEVVVTDNVKPPPLPPEELEWLYKTMSTQRGKEKFLRLRAPIDFATSGILVCDISHEGKGIELLQKKVELILVKDGWLEGRCKIKGIREGHSSTILASSNYNNAAGRVKVTAPGSIGGNNTQIKIINDEMGNERGQVDRVADGYLIKIFHGHPAISKLLGEIKKNGSYENESEKYAKTGLSEAIASVIADWIIVTRGKQQLENDPVDAYVAERNALIRKILPTIQSSLTRD